MNIIEFLQDLMSQVPFFVQPLIVAAAAAIPFLESELASVLGVWAGLNPFIAAGAAMAGNFASVFVLVVFGARIRAMIIARRVRRAELVAVGQPVAGGTIAPDEPVDEPVVEPKPESKGVRRFKKFLVRFGVPGASILGPLAIPTQFTSALLVSTGVSKTWVLLWQGVAIFLWTTMTTLIATGVLALVTS
ncbi:small multidrug efflux protein [Microbacterium sp.]|uniref:small multidrug efflux protein n=1 Tax=Microbacterium sp. TaxID=51671 RepID=UPI00273646B0|nr:small multidrug efflux protein [Microbacterium sp.]MDP3949320.1 small multidrug efflux protein [Microbacterium sp.]